MRRSTERRESHIIKYYWYRYRGRHSWCTLEVVPSTKGRTVAIVTEYKATFKVNVTIAVAVIVRQVCREFGLDPRKLVWIEHRGVPTPSPDRPRLWYWVSFSVRPCGGGFQLIDQECRPMHRRDWRELGLKSRVPGP
jgi:hypothetical protein